MCTYGCVLYGVEQYLLCMVSSGVPCTSCQSFLKDLKFSGATLAKSLKEALSDLWQTNNKVYMVCWYVFTTIKNKCLVEVVHLCRLVCCCLLCQHVELKSKLKQQHA